MTACEKCGYDPKAEEQARQAAKQKRSDAWWEIKYGVVSLVCFLIAVFIVAAIVIAN